MIYLQEKNLFIRSTSKFNNNISLNRTINKQANAKKLLGQYKSQDYLSLTKIKMIM